MIFGVGIDIVELSRVQTTYDRFGERFARRILMDEEMELFFRSTRRVRFLAMRFAGKEAAVKAMGTGFAHGVWLLWRPSSCFPRQAVSTRSWLPESISSRAETSCRPSAKRSKTSAWSSSAGHPLPMNIAMRVRPAT